LNSVSRVAFDRGLPNPVQSLLVYFPTVLLFGVASPPTLPLLSLNSLRFFQRGFSKKQNVQRPPSLVITSPFTEDSLLLWSVMPLSPFRMSIPAGFSFGAGHFRWFLCFLPSCWFYPDSLSLWCFGLWFGFVGFFWFFFFFFFLWGVGCFPSIFSRGELRANIRRLLNFHYLPVSPFSRTAPSLFQPRPCRSPSDSDFAVFLIITRLPSASPPDFVDHFS